jgi:arylsulfatase A-like enzyme
MHIIKRTTLLAITLLLVISGCSEQTRDTPPISITPLDEPDDSAWTPSLSELWRAPAESRRMQILLDASPVSTALERDLVTGWGPSSRPTDSDRVWSIGPRSILHFDLERAAPSRLELRCTPFMYPGSTDLTLAVRINDAPIGELELKDGFRDYQVQIPESALRSGRNWLELVYSRVAVPAKVLEDSRDQRELAVGFQRIGVREESPARLVEVMGLGPESEASRGWLQTRTGSFSQLVALPPAAQLEFSSLLSGNDSTDQRLRAHIDLESDSGRKILWTQPAERRTTLDRITLDLTEFAGQAVRLHFVVDELPQDNGYLWLNPTIRSRRVETSLRPRNILPTGNLVVIILDAAARDRFGVYGYPDETTPQLDALAKESLVFDFAHSQAAYTLASTASLLTSLLPARHGVVRKDNKLDPGLPTLAGALQEADFATSAFSANGFASPTFGMDSGFDHFATPGGGPGRWAVATPEAVSLLFERWIDELANEEGAADRRFFAYLHLIQPHEPYDIAPAEHYQGLDAEYQGRVDGSTESMQLIRRQELVPSDDEREHLVRLYDGNLRYVDAAVGRVVEGLRRRDLLENTMLVVMSDHGEATGERGFFGHNYSMQEEVTAIPLMIRFPAEAGLIGRDSEPASSIDIAPTALATLGVAVPDSFEGIDLLRPAISGSARPPRVIFSRSAHDRSSTALWFGEFKYLDDPGRTGRTLRREPNLDGNPNVMFDHPITYAFLNRSRISFGNRSTRTVKPGHADISDETRKALEALGYLVE